jgi:hypothetical protein
MDVWTADRKMDIRIRNQKELDKIFETVDSIYGFFVSALPLQTNLYVHANMNELWGRMNFYTPMQKLELSCHVYSVAITISRFDIRETKYFRTEIERYL